MNKAEEYRRYQALDKDPEYRKDYEELNRIGDDKQWKVKLQEMKRKYGVKKISPPTYDSQKRAREKIWPSQRTPKWNYTHTQMIYRARAEGGPREDDPPEVKQDYAEYQKYREENKKWEIPIFPKQLSMLDNLSRQDRDKYQDKLAALIEAWAKKHPELALEIFRPMVDKRKSMPGGGFVEKDKWLKLMGFVSSQDLKKPILPEYPFETYFLTVNVFAKLYGLSTDVADAILSRISEVYQREKIKMLSREEVEPSKKKCPKGKRTESETQTERIEARKAKDIEEEVRRKNLSPREILSGQYEKYIKAMGTLSRQAARKILNLEAYLHICFRNAYMRSEHGEERPWSQKSDRTPERIIESKEAHGRLAEWRKNFRDATSFSQRQKDILFLKKTGKFTLPKIADRIGCSIDTVKRELRALQSDPVCRDLLRQYGEISDDIGELAHYRNPQRRENEPRTCPSCEAVFGRGDINKECPFCHSELPRIPMK